MGKFTHDDILDTAINEIKNNATRICICSQQPTTAAEAITTYKLAIKTISSSDFTGPSNGDVSGRKLRPESGAAATAVVKTATLEGAGTNGTIYCLTEDGDIDTVGDWLGQAYYEKGTYEGHTIPVTVFTVVANLDGT